MLEAWTRIEGFPDYEISAYGEIANTRTDNYTRVSMTQQGHAKANLYLDGVPYTRSVARLVAETFIEQDDEFCDTPIHLDGDLMNCRVDNLMWRPRWFSIRYHKQFYYESFHNDDTPRVDIETGKIYHTMKELCVTNGLYCYDVNKSCTENTFVPITFQEFRLLDDVT